MLGFRTEQICHLWYVTECSVQPAKCYSIHCMEEKTDPEKFSHLCKVALAGTVSRFTVSQSNISPPVTKKVTFIQWVCISTNYCSNTVSHLMLTTILWQSWHLILHIIHMKNMSKVTRLLSGGRGISILPHQGFSSLASLGEIQSILIIHRVQIYNPKINTCGTFAVIHRHAEISGKF